MTTSLTVCRWLLLAFFITLTSAIATTQTVTVSPTLLSFGNQVQNTASSVQKVTLKNGQTTAITVTSITTNLSDYSQTNTCSSSLAAGKTCTISVTFTPKALGSRTATLTVTDTGTNSPQTVSLSGTGIAAVTVSPTNISFGNQAIGVKSAASKVTVTNNQKVALTITKISATPSDYSDTTTCPISPKTLAAASSCTVSVFFNPTVTGVRNGTLTITDNAAVSPTVSLTGSGIVAATVAPTSLTFATQAQGTSSSPQTVTLTNNQSVSLTITSVSSNLSDFSADSSCPSTLAAGSSCGVSVTFSPKAQGSRSGTLSFTDSANNSPQSVSLNGTGAAPTLLSIAVTPANPSFALGTTQTLKATGTYTDGSTQDLTTSVAWSTANPAVVTVSSQGVASAKSVASTTVTATSGSISGSTTLTVTPATLVSIAVTPAIPSVPLGTTQQFTATGTFTDGSTQNLTSTVQWNSATASVATISNAANSQGLATSVATGTTGITASSGAVSGTTTLTVTSAALVSMALSPETPSIALGTSQQFTANGTYTDGTTQDLTASATWSSDTTSVATVNKGLAASVAIGTANITATSGSTAASTALSVTAAQLVSVAINPPTASVPVGVPQQFTATGTYTDGTSQDLTQTGHWSSSAANVATISNAVGTQGSATALGTGSTTISVSSGSITASATFTVVPATLVSIAISPLNASIPLGTSQQFAATGTYTDSSTQDLTSAVTWSSFAATVAIISNATGSNGLATTSGIGPDTITATLGSISNATTLTVGSATLLSISVSPASASIPLGTTQQFIATGTYTDGSTQDLTSSATWSSTATGVASVGSNGLAVGVGVGTAIITATSGSAQGSAALTVGPPVLLSISLSPTTASVAAGRAQQFAATGAYSDGSTQDLTVLASWISSVPSVASVNSAGLASSLAQGTTSITASLGAISAAASLTVTAPVLVSISVAPSGASIPDGTNQQFTATGTYSDGSTQDLTNSVSWTSSAPAVATILSSGLATGTGIGSATMSAVSGSITGSTVLSVAQPSLVSIAVTPAGSSFALGTTEPLKATGTYTDGSTQDLTANVTWSTGDSAVATVSAQGLASSMAIGGTTVSATSGSIVGTTTLTVTPAALVSIAVTPAIPSIPSGTTLQFAATGTFTDGTTQDVTKTVQWSSDTPMVATISNATDQTGLSTSVSPGTATITAESGSVSGNTTLTVTPATLVSISVAPANPSIALGTVQQFTATGTFTDGSTQDLTSAATWSSDTPLTATINNAGLATSLAEGVTNISATSGSVVGADVLTITAAQLVSLAISPPLANVPLGLTQQFTATGVYTDGSTQDVTQSAHWSSTDAGVSTISNAPGTQGLATTSAAGSTTIEISSGSVSASAGLTVSSAALVSITINPQSPSIPLGTTQQFTASGTYTDGTTQDVTSLVTWSSSSAPVLVISNAQGSAGLATTSGLGTATVFATSGSISSSTTATVGQAELTAIAVTPANSAIAQGYTLQFSATGTYSDGSSQDLTGTVVWSSSVPSVASINATGLASGMLAGSATISAGSGSISSSTTLTVSPPVPVSLSIGPANPSIYISGQQQFAATLLYSDGTSFDVTSSVTWSSQSPGISSISSGGLATGLGAGSCTIKAAWGGNTYIATATLSVLLPSVTITPPTASIAIGGTQQLNASVTGASNQTVTWAVDGVNGGSGTLGTISTGGFYLAPVMMGTHVITATAQVNSASVGTATLTVGSPVPVVSTFFGMHLHLGPSPVPGTMEGAGRMWDSNAAQWPNLNPQSGQFVWTKLDSVLASYKSAGINDVLYTLWRVPTWASSNPTDTTCDYSNLGSGFYGSCDLPTDLLPDGTGTDLIWRTWVQNIAQHVNDYTYLQTHAKISYWEACNECYRSPTLFPGYGNGGGSVAYKGTYAQLLRMMQDARCIIVGDSSDPITALKTTCGQAGYPVTGIDASAKMVMPSTSPIQNGKNYYAQVMQNLLYCTCANNSCSASTTGCTSGNAGSLAVDVLSVHLYPNATVYTPETIPNKMATVRSYLQQSELAKPFWSDEIGWGQNSTASQVGNGDPDLEAAWVARANIMAWASGLGRAYWYAWDNAAYGTLWSPTSIKGCTTPFTSGFICSGGTAYQQVYNWLLGSTLTGCSNVGTTWTCNIVQSTGSLAQIVWDTSQTCSNGVCGTVQYAAPNTFNTYEDLTGASFSINGTVPVGIKPMLLVTQ